MSRIEWTDRSDWNPIRGCTRVSPGCGGPGEHGGCYAEAIAARFSGFTQPFEGFAELTPHGPRWTGKVAIQWDRLMLPLSWRKPAKIFANSMSDWFHEALEIEEIATLYAVAVAAVHLRGHTFQILTKRSARMREILNNEAFWDQVNAETGAIVLDRVDPLDRRSDDARATLDDYGPDNPPPGIWHGVSCEDQIRADERIPDLLATPAAVRFVSAEPLLNKIEFRRCGAPPHDVNALTGYDNVLATLGGAGPHLDWIIVGGESGPRARPMHPDWARSIRDQCAATFVPFFFKQWGEYGTGSFLMTTGERIFRQFTSFKDWVNKAQSRVRGGICLDAKGRDLKCGADFMRARDEEAFPVTIMDRVGKSRAGRLLDGVEHNAFPPATFPLSLSGEGSGVRADHEGTLR